MAEKILMLDTSVLIDYFGKTDKSKSRSVQIADEFDQVAISSITESILKGLNSLTYLVVGDLLFHIIFKGVIM
jgi:predicted nucleic-acid-binding protein